MVTREKEEIELSDKCNSVYSILSRVLPKPQLSQTIFQFVLNNSKRSLFSIYNASGYYAEHTTELKRPDDVLLVTTDVISLNRPQAVKPLLQGVEESATRYSSNMSNSTEEEYGRNGKGFKPNGKLRWNTGEDTFDLAVDDNQMNWRFPMYLAEKMTYEQAAEGKDKLKDVFTKVTWSDESRKHLWRKRIGNKLRINKALFDNLMDRLTIEGINKRAEKTIVDDLDRTFPNVSGQIEGIQMYAGMKLVLYLFEVVIEDNEVV